jgi:hypothetical protein
MKSESSNSIQAELDRVVRTESPYVLATLIRILGDFHTVEVASLHPATLFGEQYGYGIKVRPIEKLKVGCTYQIKIL